jgi:hypothetical protein
MNSSPSALPLPLQPLPLPLPDSYRQMYLSLPSGVQAQLHIEARMSDSIQSSFNMAGLSFNGGSSSGSGSSSSLLGEKREESRERLQRQIGELLKNELM